jgi:hypothetical protein
MILGQPRHVKRIKKELLNIGTWNVNTMLRVGKMQETADQIVGFHIQIVALQKKKKDGEDMVY